jgi:acid-sensing ion channel, other
MPKIKSNWSIQEGYPTESINHDFYPKRAISSGTRGGLIITMRFNKNILKTSCLVGQKGFKVLLHNPGDIPNIKRQSFQSPFNQRTIVNIKPSMITTSQNLARTSPGRRQCYFEGEKKLKFFKNYTQSNCELECRSNSTLRACGCVKYFMVRDDETPICNITSLPCLKKFRGDYAKMMKHVMIYHEENEKNSEFFCNCLPTCTSVSYDFELSQISLDMEELNDFVKYVNNDDGDDFVTATFDIIFKDDYFMSSQRNEIYGWKDFIANCGGIIGLFIGTSLISFLEIIYFLIFKLMYQRKFGESKDELQLS